MNKIKYLRKKNNMTAAELAKKLGVSQSMLTNYENGNITPRDNSIWKKIAQIFGVSETYVRGLTIDLKMQGQSESMPVYVDISKPISMVVNNQKEAKLLMLISILDEEDINVLFDKTCELLRKDKYKANEFIQDNL